MIHRALGLNSGQPALFRNESPRPKIGTRPYSLYDALRRNLRIEANEHNVMNLIIFDLDGTLTQTNEVDDLCFPLTFADHLGVKTFNVDWSAYSHGTDAVVFREAFARHFGRPPTERQSNEFEQRFIDGDARANGG